MPKPPDYSKVYFDPNYVDQLFEQCQDVRFVHKVFSPQPLLEPVESESLDPDVMVEAALYTGQAFDPAKYRLVEGGWDHDHCYVCWQAIRAGDAYWANEHPGICPDLCEYCYQELQRRIAGGTA